MIRTKGEAGTGDIVHAVKHLREVNRQMKRGPATQGNRRLPRIGL